HRPGVHGNPTEIIRYMHLPGNAGSKLYLGEMVQAIKSDQQPGNLFQQMTQLYGHDPMWQEALVANTVMDEADSDIGRTNYPRTDQTYNSRIGCLRRAETGRDPDPNRQNPFDADLYQSEMIRRLVATNQLGGLVDPHHGPTYVEGNAWNDGYILGK